MMEDLGLGVLDGDPDRPQVRVDGQKRKIWLRRSLLALATVMALVIGTAAFYTAVGLQALQGLKRDPGLLPTENSSNNLPVTANGPVNFVLIGSDSRGSDQGRSDSLMMAHLNAERDSLYLVSLPRDLYVPIPGHGKNKINAAYSFGGASLTVKTVENLTETRINHTVLIDFEGFIGLTTDVGGVTVFNEIPSTNLGFDFPRGDITLSGEKALAYVRQRYNLPNGDLDRAARQRTVVKSLILKLMKPTTLANPATFNAVAGKLGRYLTVDGNLTNEAIWNLATSVNIKTARDIRQLQAPIRGFKRVSGVGEVDLPDTVRMAKLAAALRDDRVGAYWDEHGEE